MGLLPGQGTKITCSVLWPQTKHHHPSSPQKPKSNKEKNPVRHNYTGALSAAERSYPATERSYPASEVGARQEELPRIRGQGPRWGGATPRPQAQGQGGGWKDQPHVQGAVASRAQEGLEELSHVEGQEGRQWGDTPRPR